MSEDIFEQLTARLTVGEVPPPPETFDRDVHRRVNNVLTSVHLLEFFTKAAGFAVLNFARAFMDLVILTLSGRPTNDRPRS